MLKHVGMEISILVKHVMIITQATEMDATQIVLKRVCLIVQLSIQMAHRTVFQHAVILNTSPQNQKVVMTATQVLLTDVPQAAKLRPQIMDAQIQ